MLDAHRARSERGRSAALPVAAVAGGTWLPPVSPAFLRGAVASLWVAGAAAGAVTPLWHRAPSNVHVERLEVRQPLWGFTRPSTYAKTRSTQEIDPFTAERKRHLVVYPFVKTSAWYGLSRDVRQGMMNGHIRVGKGYPDITQLLLYSVGVQDQEFVVVYETDDLTRFSDLVNELRGTEARAYTERDTPLTTALHHGSDTLELFC